MSAKPKVCIFCGAKPLSDEHIWSEWTYAILPKIKGSHTRGLIHTKRGKPSFTEVRRLKSYQGQVNVVKIRAACASKHKKGGTNSLGRTGCNNGWMGDLDTQVKPILSPLILGQPALLTERSQLTLSQWIVMKLMVAEHSEPDDVVSTQAERTALFTNRSIPSIWQIWVARQTGRLWRTGYTRQSATLGTLDETGTPIPPGGSRAKNTQLISVGFGELLIHAFATRVAAMNWDYPQGTLFRIHPFGDVLFWPPTNIMNAGQIDFLGRQFSRFQDGLRWAP